MDKKLVNVIVLGIGFMLIFTAFQTASIIQQVMIRSINVDTNGAYTGNAYYSMSIIYAVFALFNWAAPTIIGTLGSKWAMIISSLTYAIFIGNFLYPVTWVLYAVSALIGLGAALIWTGQGNYLTINSDEQTQSRNTGIFWALFQCSMLLGNLFVFLELQGVSKIDETTRQLVYGVLTGVCLIGIVLLVFLRGGRPGEVPEKTESEHSKDDCEIPEGIPEPALPAKKETLGQSIVKSFKLLKTPPMMLLSLTFFYTGLELSFYSGVYSAAIGQTLNIATDAKKYVGLSGMIIGAGEIIGGLLFTILGSKTNRLGRDMIVLLGFVVQIIAFYLCFLNLPPLSPIHDTPQPAFINSSIELALLCSFLLGFGDSCFNTQVYNILMAMYNRDSAPAFALFKFVQSLGAAIAFYYSPSLTLYWQLLILAISGFISTMSYFRVEAIIRQNRDPAASTAL